MRKLISGLIGSVWGASLLVFWGIISDQQNTTAVAMGAVLFVGGVYYLFQWKKEKSES